MKLNRFQQLHNMLKSNPNDSFLLYAIAQEYTKQDNLPEALKHYLQLTSTNPDYSGVYYHLGKLYEQMNDPTKAVETYQQGMDVCRRVGAQHDLSELQGALMLLEDD